MKKYTFPTMSILVATTIGIASVATPVRAAPGFLTGLPGSVCAAVQTNGSKLSVPPNGLISNKSTTASAIINCPMPAEYNRPADFLCDLPQEGHAAVDLHVASAISGLLERVDGYSEQYGLSAPAFSPSLQLANYFNSWTCTIPRNNGAGQNNVNGVLWQN